MAEANWKSALLAAAALPLVADTLPWPKLADVTQGSGIAFLHRSSATPKKFLIETMGSGVALLDYDGDGRLDVFLANGARLDPGMRPGDRPEKSDPVYWNRLYRNRGGWTFEDVTERAGAKGSGYSTGVAAGDFDGDGRTDLYVAGFPANQLLRNDGDGRFSDVTAASGTEVGGWSTSAGFFDYDNDGDLDLFVCRYLRWDLDDVPCGDGSVRAYCDPKQFPPIASVLLRNNGDGTFTDVSAASGIGAVAGKGLGVAFEDVNGDGWLDVVVANDGVAQSLFVNSGRGTFRNEALAFGCAFDDNGNPFAGMGVAVADADGDLWPEIFVTTLSLERYAYFRNLRGKGFDYASSPAGIGKATRPYAGWGTCFLDFDNDGRRDLFTAQGHVLDTIERTNPTLRYLQPPLLLRNLGGHFVDASAASGPVFALPAAGRGVAVGDVDGDGDLDLVVSNLNRAPQLLRNDGGNARSWIAVRLEGRGANREGLGARVEIESAGRAQAGRVTRSGGYQSSSDATLHFGLGDVAKVERIRVVWPGGAARTLESVPARRRIRVARP